VVLSLLLACADPEAMPIEEMEAAIAALGQTAPPTATLCLNGALLRSQGGNPDFSRICMRLPGLIPDCDDETCHPTFGVLDVKPALDALLQELDSNSDGIVDEGDEERRVQLAGYSWGGGSAFLLAFDGDPRFEELRVHRLLGINPYRDGWHESLEPSVHVDEAVSYRNSKAPDGDCSSSSPKGPYFGLPLDCSAEQECLDIDVSSDPDAVWTADSAFEFDHLVPEYTGAELGHCSTVIGVSTRFIEHGWGLPLQE
jgi:hypothetical protein